jgi:hypothetical protein
MIDTLITLPTDEPTIGADFEGKDLGGAGELYLVLLHDHVADHTYIVDVYHLQSAEFDTSGTHDESTLRSILQSEKILKLFWDVRQLLMPFTTISNSSSTDFLTCSSSRWR